MNHSEDREKQISDYMWVEEKIVEPILKMSKEKAWSKDEIHNSVGLIRCVLTKFYSQIIIIIGLMHPVQKLL